MHNRPSLLAVAESASDVEALVAGGFIPAPGGLIVCGLEAAKACKDRGLAYERLDLWKRFEDIPQTLRESKNISTNWWKCPEIAALCPWLGDYRGLAMGECLELVFYHVAAAALSALRAARRLLLERRPDAVALLPGPEPAAGGEWDGFFVNPKLRAVEQAAHALGIPVLRSGPSAPEIPAAESWRPPVLREPMAAASLGGLRGRVLVHAEDRHADRLMPLFIRLHEHRPGEVLYLSQDMSSGCREFLASRGEEPFDPWSLLEPGDLADMAAMHGAAREVKGRLWTVLTGWIKDRTDAGVGLWELMRFQFDWFVERGLPETLMRLTIADRALEHLEPKALFTSIDTTRNDQCWIQAARKWGVPSLSLMHGTLLSLPLPELWGTPQSDVMAVWGPMTREWCVQATGRPSNAFPCVGLPVFEKLEAEFACLDRAALRRRTSLDPSRPVVGFLLSMGGGGMEQMHLGFEALIAEVFRGFAGIEGIQVLMRGHPFMLGLGDIDQTVFHGRPPLFHPELSIPEFLRVCDVVVAQPTSVVHEAMLLDIPVIHCGVHMAEELQWWRQGHGLPFADDGDQLTSMLQLYLADGPERKTLLESQRRFNERMLGPLDGRACERFLSVLDGVIAGRAGNRTGA